MSDMPRVTIITPTYNRGDTYLRETIDSVLAQDYANMEYIVLDDGSADNTVELLQSYDDPRLRWESHANMGETRTVNKGFSMATGDYIIVLSSDDVLLPGAISTLVDFMEDHPDVLAAYPDNQIIDAQSTVVRTRPNPDYSYANMLRWHHCMPQVGTMIRRRGIELEPERNTHIRYRGDFDYWLRLGKHGPLARVPVVLGAWRTHGDGASAAQLGPKMAAETAGIVETLYANDHLPAPALQVKGAALSAAYYIAGIECLPHHRDEARAYFLKSIRACPLCRRERPHGLIKSWFHMLRVILLPDTLRRVFRREGSQQ